MDTGSLRGRIAVDLLPLQPGGGNGGIKLLTLDLVSGLCRDSWLITGFCRQEALAELRAALPDEVELIPLTDGDSLDASYDRAVAQAGAFDLNFFPMQRVSIVRRDCATVSSIMDIQFRDFPENFTDMELAERTDSFRSCLDHSDRIVAISRFTRDRILQNSDLNEEKIEVIPIVPRIAPVAPDEVEKILAAFGLTKGGYLSFPANFWPHKGHDALLEGFRLYNSRTCSQLQLVLTGDMQSQNGRRIAQKAAQIPKVKVLGYVAPNEVAAIVGQSRAVIFPSSYEGFGMPVIEAMTLGTPVVAAWSSALPEVTNRAALLFDNTCPEAIADAIAAIADDSTLCAELVAQGTRRIAELGDFNAMVGHYTAIFEQTIALDRQRNELLRGIHSDGWAGASLRIEVPPSESGCSIELNVSIPLKVPYEAVSISVGDARGDAGSAVLWRGGHYRIGEDFGPDGGSLHVTAANTFKPCEWYHETDTRDLSLLVDRITLSSEAEASSIFARTGFNHSERPRRNLVVAVIDQAETSGPTGRLLIGAISRNGADPMVVQASVSEHAVSVAVTEAAGGARRQALPWQELPLADATLPLEAARPEDALMQFAARSWQAPRTIPPADDLARGQFSVIVPSFNQGEFIGRTLDSALAQEGLCEIDVHDAVSTDDTIAVLRSYGSAIRFCSEPDKGQADAVNNGLVRARGEYIAWINSDDVYEPGAFAHIARIFATRPEVGVVYGEAFHVDESDAVIDRYPIADFDPALLRDRCFLCQPATFFRRSVVERWGGLRDSLHYCLDYEFWLRLTKAGVVFHRTGRFLAGSRVHANTKTVALRPKAYFETADMLVRGFGQRDSAWIEHFANAAADRANRFAGTPRIEAFRLALSIGKAVWLDERSA